MKTICRILILAMLHLCWLTSYGWAEIVSTQSSLHSQTQINTDRQRILELLNRQEVVDELEKYGITKVEAAARINSLSDEEVIEIAGKLDELPAGGYGGIIQGFFILGVAAFYLLGLFIKTIECIFSDCEYKGGASYVFTPFWKDEPISPEVKYSFCHDNCNSDYNECINTDNGENIQLITDFKTQCEIENQMCDKRCDFEYTKAFEEDTTEEECDPGMESCT